jgi:hypothetical protein
MTKGYKQSYAENAVRNNSTTIIYVNNLLSG